MSVIHPGLKAFIAVVKHDTVHGAAKEIGLSQTGVTQRIRTLEQQLQVTLFTRSRQGMRLTAEGEALHKYCQAITNLEGELLSFLPNTETVATVPVNITGPSTLMRFRVIPLVTPLLGQYGNLTFKFDFDDSGQGLAHLKSGSSQFAILARSEIVNELDSKLLKPAIYILVGAPAWKGRTPEDIVEKERIVDFNEADEVTFEFLRAHNLYEKAKKERHLANNTDALATLVSEGVGYSVLPEEFAEPLIKKGKLIDVCPGKTLRTEIALAWYPRPEMPPYLSTLIKSIR